MLRFVAVVVWVLVYHSLLPGARASEPALLAAPAPTEGEAAILAALDQPTALDFDDQPLSDVFDVLGHKHKIEIQVDYKALTDAGVGTDTPITIKLEGIRLRSALRLVLSQLDLTYAARDGYLLVTSKTEAEGMLKTKAYAVRDLVTADSPLLPLPPSGTSAGEDYQTLIDLITSTVAPTTWDEVGGPGSLRAFTNSHTITFSQTDEVHEEAAELLTALRTVRDQQLAAAKALPGVAREQEPREEVLQTYVYRLVPWRRGMPWPYTVGMGNMGMGGVGMGGGMFALADEKAPAGDKPAADAAPSSSPPAAKPAAAAKPDAEGENKPPAAPEFDMEQCENWTMELAHDLPELVEPESWQPHGQGSVRMLTGALVIRQSPEMHEKIAKFLAELLPLRVVTSTPAIAPAARLPAPGPQLGWPHEAEPRAAGNEAQIEAALAKKCDVDFRETPLSGAMQSLVTNTPIKLWLDHKALTDAGVGTDTPVTRTIHGISRRAVFKLLLNELDLTYIIRNEVLLITSKTEAENTLTTKVYPVYDLVAKTPDKARRNALMPFRPIQTMPGAPHRSAFAAYQSFADHQSLIDNVTTAISPTTWNEVGGPGAIREFAHSGALVISQTTEVHEEISEYLRALRQVATAQR